MTNTDRRPRRKTRRQINREFFYRKGLAVTVVCLFWWLADATVGTSTLINLILIVVVGGLIYSAAKDFKRGWGK